MPRSSVAVPTLGELSTIAAEDNPNRLAFAQGDGATVTWEAFERRSAVAADALSEYVRPGDRVAFLSESSIDTTVLWNGALKAGAIVSYVHTKASPETVRYSIDELRPSVLVVQDSFADFLAESVWESLASDPTVVVIGEASRAYERSIEAFLADAEPRTPDVATEADDIAAIAWTSGTTGRPKGWCHTHRTLFHKGMLSGQTRTSTRLTSASTSFMAWTATAVSMLVAGGSVVFLRDWEPTRWAELVEEFEVTSTGMVPTMWREVLDLDLDRYDFTSLESVGFVGEKMDRATLERLRTEVCTNVANMYGSTEVSVATITAEEMDGDRLESVGKPFGGTRVRIVEPGGSPDDAVPRGELGEILVKAPDAPVWIWRGSDRMVEEFTDGWWHSGDLGYRDEDGYLFLEGRHDFMIKSKGVKVFPGPIEERLKEHPGVNEAAVVGVEDDEYGQKVTAVVNRSDDSVTDEDLDAWCLEAETVARFERPREYRFVDSALPRTPSRKLDRGAVEERLESAGGQ